MAQVISHRDDQPTIETDLRQRDSLAGMAARWRR
jgi:hypothetical protein